MLFFYEKYVDKSEILIFVKKESEILRNRGYMRPPVESTFLMREINSLKLKTNYPRPTLYFKINFTVNYKLWSLHKKHR